MTKSCKNPSLIVPSGPLLTDIYKTHLLFAHSQSNLTKYFIIQRVLDRHHPMVNIKHFWKN